MEILARPTEFDDRAGPAFWIDEGIWGHRLHDEQSPWLTFLEFLTVLLAEHDAGRALREDRLNSLSYRPQLQLHLRNLVFNNPHVMTIRALDRPDEAAWALWLDKMAETAGGLDKPDFGYLRERFESFEDFAAVVGFLQGSAIEGSSNKRWSSKFVFPFGRHALYEDVNVKPGGSVSNDRRFLVDRLEIEPLRVEMPARPAEVRCVIVVFGIADRFQEIAVGPRPADIFGRARPCAVEALRLFRGGRDLGPGFDPNFMLPVVAEIIDVDEDRIGLAQKIEKPHLGIVKNTRALEAIIQQIRIAIAQRRHRSIAGARPWSTICQCLSASSRAILSCGRARARSRHLSCASPLRRAACQSSIRLNLAWRFIAVVICLSGFAA